MPRVCPGYCYDMEENMKYKILDEMGLGRKTQNFNNFVSTQPLTVLTMSVIVQIEQKKRLTCLIKGGMTYVDA